MRQLYWEGIGVGLARSPSDRLEGDGDAQPDQRGESLRQDSVCIAVNLQEGIEIRMRYSHSNKAFFGVFFRSNFRIPGPPSTAISRELKDKPEPESGNKINQKKKKTKKNSFQQIHQIV